MARKATLSSLVKKLDRVFSVWVRRSRADEGGTVECCSCGRLFHWEDVDAGHLFSRRHMSTRFDEMNVWPQCRHCNRFSADGGARYATWFVRLHGNGALEALEMKSREVKKFTRGEVEELIRYYTGRISES